MRKHAPTTAGDTEEQPDGVRRSRVRRRRSGWRNADVLRTASLVIGMYLLVRLLWFAHPLFLTAFLGMLFGLAVASGVDVLSRWRIPRGLSAALIVLAFLGGLVGFGAWMAPTIHSQMIELRRQLPAALDRLDTWVNARRSGFVGMIFSGLETTAEADSASATPSPASPSAVGAPQQAQPPQAAAQVVRQPAPAETTVASTLRRHLGTQVGGATRF
ncbi:MAG TPA: AI-2E family transporter, partial [Gemmatimonadaceae bacterium]|nr:AI-2E family transporter [Gemmatimonadaceae bacterium]